MTKRPAQMRFGASLRDLFRRLTPVLRRRFFLALVSGGGCAGMEALTVAGIAVFATSVIAPEAAAQRFAQLAAWLPALDFLVPLAGTSKGTLLLGLALTVLVCVKNVLRAVVVYATTRFATDVDCHFGNALVGGFLRMPYSWHLRQNSSDLVAAAYWQTYFGTGMLSALMQLVSEACVAALLLLTLLLAQPLITLGTMLVIAAAAYLITSRVHKFLDATSKDCRKHRLAMYKWLNTMLQGIKDVLISGGEQSFRAAYDQEAIQAARLTAVQKLTTDLPSQIIETVGILLLVATIFLLSLGEGDGRGSTTGSMALLAICAWRLLPAANRILAGLSSLRTSLPYVDSGLKHLAAVERLSPATSALVEAPALRQELGLEDIFFSYEGVDILAGISLRVPCGEVLGLVGRSGAGKSTVADIIMGLLEPTRGRMLLDGLPLAAEALPSWRRQVGYVPQDPFLMDGTLAENIAFGDPDPDRQRIADCCTMASMDFLETLAEGLNTVLGERGLRLSGGQRQRVAIARALYHDPKILVFDEATSALDAGHERAVQETILGLRGERTLILIAHRLETLHHCDRLIWIEQGGVVQVGTPEQILPDYQQALDTAT